MFLQNSTKSRAGETAETSQVQESIIDQADHPTAGRRRRHKSPASVPPVRDLPLPRLLDHMGAEDGPSYSAEEKDGKRQRSASTTPRSTMGTFPYEYDRAMGVTSVRSHESERFGDGNDPETEDTPDTLAHNREICEEKVDHRDVVPGVGEFHGRFGSASLRECVKIATQSTNSSSAPCHSEDSVRESPFHMNNPSQKTSKFAPQKLGVSENK